MYLFLSTNNGSSATNAPDVGSVASGSSFHPLNSVIPTPLVEHELELDELLELLDSLELLELLELLDELDSELELLELLELVELELDELLELMLIE